MRAKCSYLATVFDFAHGFWFIEGHISSTRVDKQMRMDFDGDSFTIKQRGSRGAPSGVVILYCLGVCMILIAH